MITISHLISTIMVSKGCPIIVEHVVISYVKEPITVATA